MPSGTDAAGHRFEGRAIRSLYEDWLAAFEEFTMRVSRRSRLRQRGGRLRWTGAVVRRQRGQVNSLRVAWTSGWTVGLIARITNNRDIDEARAAAERLAEERG